MYLEAVQAQDTCHEMASSRNMESTSLLQCFEFDGGGLRDESLVESISGV
jgi:hypothetical protein